MRTQLPSFRGDVKDPTAAVDGRQTSAARLAISDIAPFAIALIPFALAIGTASATAGLTAWESTFGAVALLAGAAQLAAIEVIAADGGVVSAVVVVALINLRFVFYGAGLASWFADAPLRRRLLLAYPIVDQTFLLCRDRFERRPNLRWRQQYYLTATAILAGSFLVGQTVAFRLGATLPAGLRLELAAPLAFAGMLGKAATGRRELIAAAVAAGAVALGAGSLGSAALPVGVVVGVTVGMVAGEKGS